jgi:hypothetical protein
MKRAAHRTLLACLLIVTSGCLRGIVPQTPRVAEGPGYRLALTTIHGKALPDATEASNQIEVQVSALQAGTTFVAASIQRPDETPCLALAADASYGARPFPYHKLERRRRPSAPLMLPFASSELFGLRGPARLDLELMRPDGSRACATFPLFDDAPEYRWRALESFSTGMAVQLAFLTHAVEHLSALTSVNLVVGKWLGPVQLYAGGGAGLSTCSEQPCHVSAGDPATNRGYYPVFAGLDALLFRGKYVAAKLGGRYKVAWTRTDAPGPDPKVFLHGPELLPGIYLAHQTSGTPGLPNLPDRMLSISADLPVGYVMSRRGEAAWSLGLTVSMTVFVY